GVRAADHKISGGRIRPGREATSAKDGSSTLASGGATGAAGRGRRAGDRHLPSAHRCHFEAASRRGALKKMPVRTTILSAFFTAISCGLICAQETPGLQ